MFAQGDTVIVTSIFIPASSGVTKNVCRNFGHPNILVNLSRGSSPFDQAKIWLVRHEVASQEGGTSP